MTSVSGGANQNMDVTRRLRTTHYHCATHRTGSCCVDRSSAKQANAVLVEIGGVATGMYVVQLMRLPRIGEHRNASSDHSSSAPGSTYEVKKSLISLACGPLARSIPILMDR